VRRDSHPGAREPLAIHPTDRSGAMPIPGPSDLSLAGLPRRPNVGEVRHCLALIADKEGARMRKEVWATAAAITLLSNLSVAAELEAGERKTVRKIVTTDWFVYSPTELRWRLSPSCHESFSAVLLHCSPQLQVYPPYDLGRPRPYQQPFSWSRND
jgi:hypothetical protein